MASKKVRVVAKIRGFSDPDTENSRTVDWVSVKTQDSGDVTISFKEQSSSRYSVDYCYNQHDDNEMIYSREVKPLVSAAFEGFNSTVIAHGARGSGKTHLIQGSLERPGLAALATSEFLSMAEKNGKSIAVSLYEVDHQDHAVDLLNPEQPQILVLEDHGRIQFKGLSQAPVKSISEFQNLYIAACSANKAAPKKGIERAHRSHIGLIVHVFSQNESMNGLVSKMTFVDMAGYEDARRKSSDASGHVENNKLNKSIYALLNVCQALSTNESRVPFRESKLTRMLQDSLRGTSKVLLVSCLNPSFCQDTVYMVSLASRSCQSINQTPLDSMKKTSSSTRQIATWDSTKKSASSAREIVTLDSTKKNASSARKIVTLDSTKKNASSVRQNVATDSSNKKSSSVRQTVTLDSTKKSASLVRQNVASDSSKKISSSVRQTVTLDSTKKSASSAIQTVTSDSTKKTASSARQTVASDSTKKTASSAIHTVASDSTKKSASSAIQIVASNSTKKSANSAILTVTYRKKKIPQSVSASTNKLPGSISHIKENGVVATNSAIKGRKLFDEASHSAVKAEKDNSISKDGNDAQVNSRLDKEISIADVTRASESLLDNSLSEDGNHDELNSRVEKDNSSLNASSEVEFDPTVEKVISSEDKHPCIINYSKDLSIADEGHNMNKENNNLIENEDFSPPISSQLRELQSLVSSTPLCMQLPENECISHDDDQISAKIAEPTTLDTKRRDVMNTKSPWETFNKHGSEMENSTEITEPRTPDAGRGDVMNTKSPWETFNMNGSGMKNSTEITEPRTPDTGRRGVMNTKSPWETFNLHGSGMKNSLVKDYLRILNTAEKDELKKLKGIGEKRATYILELREESPEPFNSPGPGSQSHLQMFSFNLEKVDIDSLTRLGSSLAELLPQFDNLNSIDCSVLSSTTMNKLMLLKADISKLLEVTETEIDSLETELRSLKSKSEGRFSCSTAVGSLVCCNSKSCDKHVGASDKVAHFEPLQIVSSDDLVVEKTPFSSNLLDNPEPARSKFVEHLPMINAVSRCDVGRYGNCLEDLDGIQSTSVQCLVPCTYRHVANVSSCGNNSSLEVVSSCGDNNSSLEVKNGVDAKSSASFYSSTEDNLYDQIISCNKKIAKEASDVIAKLMPEKCRKNNNIGASSGSCSHDGTFIMEGFAKRRRSARLKERVVTLKFKALQHLWKEDSSLLSTRKHRPKSHKKIELDLRTTNNGHQKKRSSFRFPSPAANKLRLVPTSEMIKYTSQLLSESKHDIHRSTLKMPALILDQKEKMNSMFLSSNGLVEDPLAIEKERAMINPWTSEEKEVFLEKFAAFGKDFQKISTFLDHKTTADCVEFYYKNHKSDCFEKIKKKDDDKVGKFFNAKTDLIKWNSEANTSSLEVLRAASVTADGIALNRKMRSGRSLWRGYDNKTMSKGDKIIAEKPNSHAIIQEERETNAAADVLASICDDFHLPEAASSSITSSADPVKGKRVRKSVKARAICKQPPMPVMTQSIDPESCSDESCGEMELTDWTDVEKAAFLHALSSFGKDFAKIAQCVGTRSQFQCRAFFCKTHKRIGMDLMGERAGVVGSPGDDDVDGGRSDADNACIPETASANGSDTSGSKTVVDQPAYDKNLYQEESNPLVARNLSAESDESEEINGKADRKEVNIFSNAYMTGSESKLGTDCNAAVLYSFDGPATVQHQSAIVISDSTEILKDKPSEGGGAVTELVSDMGTIEPCCSNSAAEGRLVSDGSSGLQGNELEASTVCRVDSDEVVTDVVVELKDNVHNSRTSGNTSLSPVEASCSRLSADAENEPQLCLEKPQFSGLSEGPVTKLNMNMICSSSATELPLLPQKVEQQGAHKSLQCLPNSEDTPNVKIFGKVLTIPSSTQKPNSSAKRNEENGTHDNTGTESAKLKVYDNDFRGIDFNAPIMNSGHGSTVQPAFSPPLPDFNAPYMGCSHGNTIQSGFSSLPASSILLAKYPAAFGLNAQPFIDDDMQRANGSEEKEDPSS